MTRARLVLTPEHVEIRLEPAGLGSRFVALTVDLVLMLAAGTTASTLATALPGGAGPLVRSLLLLLLGLPILASRSEWNLFIRIGWCLLIFTLIQAIGMGCTMMVKTDSIDPALAAWLPLLLLGPLVPSVVTSMRT